MATDYDVFVSYAHADRERVRSLVAALRERGLAVRFDESAVEDIARVTDTVNTGVARSKALLVWYSAVYPTRRACQWELTAGYLAASRQNEPAQRILVVNPESGTGHLYPRQLRDARFRPAPAPKDAKAVAELAGAVARHVDALTGTLGTVCPLVPRRWVPTQGMRSARFVGRVAEMWEIHSALQPEAAVVQLRGLGGVGKSLLAEEYALRFAAAYPGGVFRLRAYGSHAPDEPAGPGDPAVGEWEARRQDELCGVALGIGLRVADRNQEQLPRLLAAAIEERCQPCLWVVDDLPEGLAGDQVRGWFAPHPLAATLVTTRSQAYGAIAPAIDVDVLGPDEAYELLTARRSPSGEAERAAARGIVADLGGHALAADVAGAGLRNLKGLVSYADFHTMLGEPDQDELELIKELADALPDGHEACIARTLSRSLDQLSDHGGDVVRLAAALATVPIPARLVAAVVGQADDLDGRQAVHRAGRGLEQAASLSLAAQVAGEQVGAWSVHALVARTVRFREPVPARLASLRAAAVAVLTGELAVIVDARAHVFQDVVPHARELARHAADVAEAELLGWVARYDYERGTFTSARALYEQVLDAQRRLLGEEHLDTLVSMGNLATTLSALGDLAGAQALHEQVLDARRRLDGEEHPDTLTSMNNLANTLYRVGDLAGAQALHEQVLDARRQLLGEEHPDTLTSMNNLAETLHESGDLAGARTLEEQAVDGFCRLLGEQHPDTRAARANLDAIIRSQGDHRERSGGPRRRCVPRFLRRSGH